MNRRHLPSQLIDCFLVFLFPLFGGKIVVVAVVVVFVVGVEVVGTHFVGRIVVVAVAW